MFLNVVLHDDVTLKGVLRNVTRVVLPNMTQRVTLQGYDIELCCNKM